MRYKSRMNFMTRIIIILVLGLGISGVIAYSQIKNETTMKVVEKNFGGPFTLTDQDGKEVTEKDYEGQYRLIYFGFTYCPAICPTELQRMASVLKDLSPKGDLITPIFITVDPERDTVDTMKQYVELFHPRLIGLTGTPEQIKEITKAYKIYYAKVQDETMSDYTMDHSSFIYFMAPNNDLLKIFKMDDEIDYMVKTIHRFID